MGKSTKIHKLISTLATAADYDLPLFISEIREAKEFQEAMWMLSDKTFKPSIETYVRGVRETKARQIETDDQKAQGL